MVQFSFSFKARTPPPDRRLQVDCGSSWVKMSSVHFSVWRFFTEQSIHRTTKESIEYGQLVFDHFQQNRITNGVSWPNFILSWTPQADTWWWDYDPNANCFLPFECSASPNEGLGVRARALTSSSSWISLLLDLLLINSFLSWVFRAQEHGKARSASSLPS